MLNGELAILADLHGLGRRFRSAPGLKMCASMICGTRTPASIFLAYFGGRNWARTCDPLSKSIEFTPRLPLPDLFALQSPHPHQHVVPQKTMMP